MEIIITKCYVELESKEDLEWQKEHNFDQYSIDRVEHFIHFNLETVERKLKLTSTKETINNIEKYPSKYIEVFDDKTNKYEYVGNVEDLNDYPIHSKFQASTCTRKDKELSIRIVDYLWDNNFTFYNENPVDVQCEFSLNHKFEIKSSPMKRWGY